MLLYICLFEIISTLIVSTNPSCDIKSEPRDDINLEVGKDIIINCILDNTCDKNASDIKWSVINNSYINNKYIKIINNFTAQLNISSATVNNTGFYYCFAKKENINLSTNKNMVKIGYKPLENVSFNCKSFNLDILTCSWSSQTSTFSTTWKLSYSHQKLWEICSQVAANSCTIEGSYGYPSISQDLSFTLFGSNKLGNQTQNFTIQHYKIVTLAPPKVINYTVNSRSVLLKWENPLKKRLHNRSDIYLIYNISYKNKWQTLELVTNYTEYRLKDLKPYTNYTITISAKLEYNFNLNQWGQPVTEEIQTKEAKPENWKALAIGSFQELNKNEIEKTIILYFKILKLNQFNSKNLIGYKIFDINSGIEPITTTKPYVEIRTSVNKSYIFQISAINNIGETTSNQSLFISNNSPEIPKPHINDLINYENGTYLISWNSTDTSLDYTIFWCKIENENLDQEESYIRCANSGLNWTNDVQCGANLCQQHVTVSETNQYRFAVAAKSGNLSNGLVWSTCTISISQDRIPVLKPRIETIDSTWAKVSWNIPCNERISTITSLNVYYYIQNSTSENNQTLPYFGVNSGEFTLDNLKSGSTYLVEMAVVTSSGTGDRSEATEIQTQSSNQILEETNDTIVIVTTISVPIALVSIIALCFLLHKKFKEKMKILSNFPDHIPRGILDPNKFEYTLARRESGTCFTIQLPPKQLQSHISVDSNTSGFISDSLESILTPTTRDHCPESCLETEENNTNKYMQKPPEEANTKQLEEIKQSDVKVSQYITSIPKSTNDGKYIQLEANDNVKSIPHVFNTHGYVQAVSLNPSDNINANNMGYIQATNLNPNDKINTHSNKGYVQQVNLRANDSINSSSSKRCDNINTDIKEGYVQVVNLNKCRNSRELIMDICVDI